MAPGCSPPPQHPPSAARARLSAAWLARCHLHRSHRRHQLSFSTHSLPHPLPPCSLPDSPPLSGLCPERLCDEDTPMLPTESFRFRWSCRTRLVRSPRVRRCLLCLGEGFRNVWAAAGNTGLRGLPGRICGDDGHGWEAARGRGTRSSIWNFDMAWRSGTSGDERSVLGRSIRTRRRTVGLSTTTIPHCMRRKTQLEGEEHKRTSGRDRLIIYERPAPLFR